ncbi:hypothetical protein LEP1GSC202_2026 [Leptospira yanagawae serovar Saopaulo str. Sao Paulo = ATCC 700523]|uniref:Uncharacterized protein n=2 Tax=Leptospira yanagawae TaxID=293069 RepID=A0A5E8H8Y7_9LEPT|nr:hypothetical protein LEP1GSC202_2026 [Leptospira yanagawae serovar Saopaulo str. Sao Paulo = ATCC 700523]
MGNSNCFSNPVASQFFAWQTNDTKERRKHYDFGFRINPKRYNSNLDHGIQFVM